MKRLISLTFFIFIFVAVNAQNASESHTESGFANRTEIGDVDLGNFGFELRSINGYQINDHWSAGVGIGFTHISNATLYDYQFIYNYEITDGISTVPIFLDLKYDLRRNKHSFYFYADAGYSFLLSSAYSGDFLYYSNNYTYTVSYTGGFIGSGGIGYSKYISPKTE